MHLDKRNRDLIKEMLYDEVFGLIHPLLERKGEGIGEVGARFELFSILAPAKKERARRQDGHEALDLNEGPNRSSGARAQKQTQALLKTLGSMSFSGLVTVLCGREDAPNLVKSGFAKDAFMRFRATLA